MRQVADSVYRLGSDNNMAVESLQLLEGLDTAMVLPGHGEPWSGQVADAVATIRGA